MQDLLEMAVVNPNLIYLALVVGLWVGVTAVYMFGTGIPEVASLLLLAGSIFALTMMPTNWLAVLLLIVGIGAFLVLPFILPRYAPFAELGLVLQAVGGYFLFTDPELVVSPLLIAMTVGLAWLYNRFVLLPILRSQQRPSVYDETNEIVGAFGRVVKPLDPVGTVNVRSELWTARSDEPLEAGTPIVVLDRHGLELTVEKAKRDFQQPEPYPYEENGHRTSVE